MHVVTGLCQEPQSVRNLSEPQARVTCDYWAEKETEEQATSLAKFCLI